MQVVGESREALLFVGSYTLGGCSCDTGCNQGRQELSSNYLLFASFLVTCEDAKAYMYSMSSKRRVHKWKDIRVNLYI